MSKRRVNPSLMDNVVGVFSPKMKNNRIAEKFKLMAFNETGYLVPGSNRNSMKGSANVTANSPDFDTASKLSGSRGMSRDLTMNAPLASAAVKRIRNSAVGSGLQLQPTIDHVSLGITEEQARAWEKNTENRFKLWGESKLCDFTRRTDFNGMQRLVVMSFLQNGDCFALPVFKAPERSGLWPYELRVRLVEADLVRTPDEYTSNFGQILANDSIDVVSGMEQGKNGQVIAAWFAHKYLDNSSLLANSRTNFTRVESHDKKGRANYLHIFDPDRISQRRGMPLLAPVVNLLRSLTRLGETELQAQIVAAMYTVFIKDANAGRDFDIEAINPKDTLFGGGSLPDEEGEQTQQAKDEGHEWEGEMGAATIVNLDNDKEIQIADPRQISEGFQGFYDSLVTELGAGINLPREVLLQHFTSSYTASRAAFIEAWNTYRIMRDFIIRSFNQPIYEEFLLENIAKGFIIAPGFMDDPLKRKLWSGAQWVGPGMGSLNPLVEAKASAFKIDNNLSNHSREYAANEGGDWQDMMTRRKSDENFINKMELQPVEKQDTPLSGNGDDGGDNAGNDDDK